MKAAEPRFLHKLRQLPADPRRNACRLAVPGRMRRLRAVGLSLSQMPFWGDLRALDAVAPDGISGSLPAAEGKIWGICKFC